MAGSGGYTIVASPACTIGSDNIEYSVVTTVPGYIVLPLVAMPIP